MGVFGPRGVNRRLSQHQILPLRGINRLEDLQSDQPSKNGSASPKWFHLLSIRAGIKNISMCLVVGLTMIMTTLVVAPTAASATTVALPSATWTQQSPSTSSPAYSVRAGAIKLVEIARMRLQKCRSPHRNTASNGGDRPNGD